MTLWLDTDNHKWEFADQVLKLLQKRKVLYLGCPPHRLELSIDGTAKMWFCGKRKGLPWSGGIKIKGHGIESNVAMARPEILADLIAEQIYESRRKFDI